MFCEYFQREQEAMFCQYCSVWCKQRNEEAEKLADDISLAIKEAIELSIMKSNTTFKEIADRIVSLQAKKNESYGNAFEQSCDKYGIVSALTRLNDKLNRLDSLYKSSEQSAFGESFTDTLTDLAAYAIMTIEWLENHKCDDLP